MIRIRSSIVSGSIRSSMVSGSICEGASGGDRSAGRRPRTIATGNGLHRKSATDARSRPSVNTHGPIAHPSASHERQAAHSG